MSDAREIVMVGHCGPDIALLKRAVHRAVPEAPCTVANDEQALRSHCHSRAILLINRVLEDGFEMTSGIELITGLMRLDDPPIMLLISNHSEAQDAAVRAGACQGFGKTQLSGERTKSILVTAWSQAARNDAGDCAA